MAALCGAPPRNLSRFKLTHAEPTGVPEPGAVPRGARAPRYGRDNIAVHPNPPLFVFLLEDDRPDLFFLSLTIARRKEASDRRHAGFDKSLPRSASLDTRIICDRGNPTCPLSSPSPSSSFSSSFSSSSSACCFARVCVTETKDYTSRCRYTQINGIECYCEYSMFLFLVRGILCKDSDLCST